MLKVADWGLGRNISQPAKSYTPEVQTLIYRAPEIIAHRTNYHCEVDMWSAGLIIGEMLKGSTVLSARGVTSEFQLVKEWRMKLGLPSCELYGKDCLFGLSERALDADMSHFVKARPEGMDEENKACIKFIRVCFCINPDDA